MKFINHNSVKAIVKYSILPNSWRDIINFSIWKV